MCFSEIFVNDALPTSRRFYSHSSNLVHRLHANYITVVRTF